MDDPDKLVGLGPSNIAEPVNNEAKKFIQRHVCRGTEVEGNFETRTRQCSEIIIKTTQMISTDPNKSTQHINEQI